MNSSDERQEIEGYWRNALADCDCTPFPALPPSVQQPAADGVIEREIPLPRERSSDITTSNLIRASWALVTGRFTNSDDVVFGAAVCGKTASVGGIDTMAAPTIATVPVRIKLASDQRVSEYLETVQRQATEMIPFEQAGLQRIAKICPGSQQACMFQTLLIVPPQEKSSTEDLLGKWQNGSQQQWSNMYGLMLELQLGVDKITATASFDSRAIEPWTVKKLLERLDYVLRELDGADLEQTLGQIKMVTHQDLEEIWQWNNAVPASVERCVHEMVEERAQAQPNTPAVCAWDGELTYGELNQLATRLAGRLVDHGVGPDVLVPLCFEKSMWTTVAMLGVLKAGGGFVLLDNSLPEQRLQAIVRQVGASLLLSSLSNQALSARLATEVVTVSSGFFRDLGDQAIRHLPGASPSSVMYVVFTSGSTGTPKGVVITHRNLASAFHHQVELIGFTTKSRSFDFTSYSFDICIGNTLMTLATGGCLCVPSDQDRRNKLADSIRSLHANVVHLTPSVAQLLVPEETTEIHTIILAGEAVHVRDVRRWWDKVNVLNIYGPSECTPFSTINYTASSPEEVTRIGKGSGLVTWVVDPDNHDHLLPLGCVGELLLEGPLVGPGYLNDPEKTAAAFVEDPEWLLQGTPGRPGRHGRLYKTGDLVQYNEDGSLTFMGRKDAQVKIHGQRVELGEVEHRVQEGMPEARQVVAEVIVPQGKNSSPVLAAFVRMNDMTAINEDATGTDKQEPFKAKILTIAADVEEKLAKHLPSYMVPTVFFAMRELPMTATGKTNRRRLREIGGSFSIQQLAEIRTAGRETKRQPTSQLELQMQIIWGEVLGINPATIGLDDSFFHLGGDSIAAMKAIGKARKVGIELAVADIFRHPKLEQLASQAISLVHSAFEDIVPFSLLGDGVEITSLLRDISSQCQLDPATVQDGYPCTPLQEGLMSLSLQRPGDYIMQATLELSPDLIVRSFCNAWEEVVRTIEILRTRIVQHNDVGLFQVVLDEKIRWIEATSLNEYLQTDRQQPMEMGQPLTRYALIKDDGGVCRWFVWTVHHALYDGWSLPLIIDAVNRVYRGDVLEPGPHFNTFIKYMGQQDDGKMADYWRKALVDCDVTPFPALPPSVQQPAADRVMEREISLPRERSLDITTSNLIRAAWALVTGRFTNSDDVIFGATVSGRTASVGGIDTMAAPTIATVPVRIKLASNRRVSEYLETVQRQTIEMIPFEQAGLQRIVKICPNSQQACKFQTLLIIQPQEHNSAEDLLGKWQHDSERGRINTYALLLELHLGSDKITATASFDSRVIEPWTVKKLLERLDFVLRELDGADPNQTLAQITMVTRQDLEEIWQWNSTVPEPVERCVHEMVEERAQAQPNAPAVCAWDGELTYSQLDQLATKLAGRLVDHGVGPDVLVPLCFEKSMWTTVAILGVLKAGGAFVLLDPSLPEQRLQAIVRQVEASLVLSSVSNQALSSRLANEVVTVSSGFFADLGDQAIQHLPSRSPSSVMYVIFTSGSTGTPKGVLITHRNLASALYHQVEFLGLTTASRVFDFASYSFDPCISNIFRALIAGGCLCVPSDEDRKNRLADSIASLHANFAELTPTAAQFILPKEVPELQSIMFGGEAVRIQDVTPWWSNVRFFNAYGPAECTPTSMVNCTVSSPEEATRIGKGVGQVTWVVDPENHNHLLPLGCIGELLLEGPLVGLGYLNDLGKTRAAFVEDPAWLLRGAPGRPGRHGRLYKTGDLVRYNEDGSLTFMGRKDTQVKIRGQRVELGEVEQWVQECMPAARQVVAEVIVPQGENSSPALAAFIQMEDNVTETGEQESATAKILTIDADIEEKLADALPSYMVPTVFFSVWELPMTPTGKTDRKRLREIGGSFSVQQLAEMRTAGRGTKRQPTVQAEQQIQRIWARVLNIEPATIGLDDSFFQLGGDSITAMKVVGEARKVGIELSVTDIFRHPKLEHLATSGALFSRQCSRGYRALFSPGRRRRHHLASSGYLDSVSIGSGYGTGRIPMHTTSRGPFVIVIEAARRLHYAGYPRALS